MNFGIREYLILLSTIILALYYYSASKLNYWKKKGVPGPKPITFLGNFASNFFRQSSFTETIKEFYDDWKDYPFIGVYKGHIPQLIINDLDLIKTILVKDFSTFHGRGILVNEDVDPLSAHLIHIQGPRWKLIRANLTPIFTTGKLKHMVELIVDCANHFEEYLKNEVGKGNVIDCRDVAAKFTTDIIGSCAFGINMNAISRDDNEFRKIGKKLFEGSFINSLKQIIGDVSPWLFETLKIAMIPDDITDFFIKSIKNTIEMRKRENIVRNDLIDLLVEFQKKYNNKDFGFTDVQLTAQAFVFFAAGFEPTSTTISFALYEISLKPKVQDKLRKEIIETLKKHNGHISYDIINQMKYMEMVIQETLRKNPPVTTLQRQAYQSYTIPETNITIEKGTFIHIPLYAIHYDSKFFPDPELFDPERFSDENKAQTHPMAFMPFGDGPKNCIAGRFSAYQVKLGIIKVLKNFVIKPSKSTVVPYKIDRGSVLVLAAEGGNNLLFEPLH